MLEIINIADPDVMTLILFSKLLFLIFLTDLIEDIIEKFQPFYSAIRKSKNQKPYQPPLSLSYGQFCCLYGYYSELSY